MENYIIDYDLYADDYFENRKSNSLVYSLLKNLLSLKEDSNVLEYGCGTGNYLIDLEKAYCCNFYGIDNSEKMIVNAKKRTSKAEFTFIENLPLHFEKVFFDNIYSVDVVHHIQELNPFFSELYRVASPKCQLVLCTESPYQLEEKYWVKYFPSVSTIDKKRFHSIEHLKKSAKDNGWKFKSQTITEQFISEPVTQSFLDKVKSKSISVFALLDSEEYQLGLDNLHSDFRRKIPIQKKEGYTFLLFERGVL